MEFAKKEKRNYSASKGNITCDENTEGLANWNEFNQ